MKEALEQIKVEFKKEYEAGELMTCSWRRDDQSLGEELVFNKTEEVHESRSKQLKARVSSLTLWFGERVSASAGVSNSSSLGSTSAPAV